ncbi:MAG: PrsW family intramembrane metalloprotease [Kofleriaceae bacterium]
MAASQLYVAAAGAVPALVAMWYFDRLDRRRPEPAGLRRLVALCGALSVIPILIADGVLLGALGDARPPESSYGGALFTSFVVAALIEESGKVAVVYLVAWRRRAYDERLDAVVYGARAGLGFAMVENILYLMGQVELKGVIITWILRAVLAVPGHALWTTIATAGGTRRRFDKRGPGVVGGLALAVLLHGSYDAALFLAEPLRLDGHDGVAYALLGVPLLVIIASWWIVTRYARTALALDDADAARNAGVMPPPPGGPAPAARPGYPGYGYPPPGHGYPPPGYGYPPSGYGYPPPGYGYPPPGYGYPPPGHGYPPPGHAHPPPGFVQAPGPAPAGYPPQQPAPPPGHPPPGYGHAPPGYGYGPPPGYPWAGGWPRQPAPAAPPPPPGGDPRKPPGT